MVNDSSQGRDTPIYLKDDHDLLIYIATKQDMFSAEMRADLKDLKASSVGLESRVRSLEKDRDEIAWLRGAGKYVWSALLVVLPVLLSLYLHFGVGR